jgi:putative acyl-CoA dehydrogenase
MEVLGGNGYVEECVMPRIYRELPVNSIWEGSGNIMCLDMLRALERTPHAGELLLREVGETARGDKRLRSVVGRLERELGQRDRHDESQARAIVRDLVLAMQGALLLQHAPTAVADAFCASRLGDDPGGTFGLLPASADFRAIVERASPLPQ